MPARNAGNFTERRSAPSSRSHPLRSGSAASTWSSVNTAIRLNLPPREPWPTPLAPNGILQQDRGRARSRLGRLNSSDVAAIPRRDPNRRARGGSRAAVRPRRADSRAPARFRAGGGGRRPACRLARRPRRIGDMGLRGLDGPATSTESTDDLGAHPQPRQRGRRTDTAAGRPDSAAAPGREPDGAGRARCLQAR